MGACGGASLREGGGKQAVAISRESGDVLSFKIALPLFRAAAEFGKN